MSYNEDPEYLIEFDLGEENTITAKATETNQAQM